MWDYVGRFKREIKAYASWPKMSMANMDESTLVKTFEMLLERLGKIEDNQTELMRAIQESDEAKGADWIPGRVHCGFPVRIYRCCECPLTYPNIVLCIHIDFNDGVQAPLDNRVYWDWLFNGAHTFDINTFPPDVQAALKHIKQRQEEIDAVDPQGSSYDPRCEELGLFHGQRCGKMFMSEWMCTEVAKKACGNECQVSFAALNDTDVVALRFPHASKSNPVGLTDVMRSIAKLLGAFGASLNDVHSVELKRLQPHHWLLYLQLLNDFGDRHVDAAAEFKRLTKLQQRVLCENAKCPGDLFNTWCTDLQRWMDD